jgi:hypothetical protein
MQLRYQQFETAAKTVLLIGKMQIAALEVEASHLEAQHAKHSSVSQRLLALRAGAAEVISEYVDAHIIHKTGTQISY